jgi:glycosyltransferase involved in cell wall biosynthesis
VICNAAEAISAAETIAHVANRAAAHQPDADLALILKDVQPPSGWLDRLQVHAAAESTTATVSVLSGVWLDSDGLGDELALVEPVVLDGEVAAAARVILVTGPCLLITRAAFDLLGGLDETLSTSASAVADFGLRASERGLANLIAGDVLVQAQGVGRLTPDDRVELERRHPVTWTAALQPATPPLERSLDLARITLRKLCVTIDARALGPAAGGTQVYAYQLISALARTGELRIRALVGPDPEVAELLESLAAPEDITVISYEQALAGVAETDVVHRPQQVFTLDDLELIRPLGRRLVITHLDLIAFHNPTYFAEVAHWERHVRATRMGLAAADHVVFFSSYALRDAEREDLVDTGRTSIVPLGVDLAEPPDATQVQPPGLDSRSEPFLLCLGADYAHKNRPFALELTAEMRRAHGWPGIIVLVGAHVEHGSSAIAERVILERRPELAGAVIDLGPVSERERRWLMTHAAALLYPTVLEGFGLVPFEAAAARVPCLFASQSSLADLLPAELSTLDGWNLERSSALASRILSDEQARTRHIEGLRGAADAYTWRRCAEGTIEAYHRAVASRQVSSGRAAWEALRREQEIVRLDRVVHDLQSEVLDAEEGMRNLVESLGADGLALVGPEGLLSNDDRRALLSLAVRPKLSRPLFAAARAGYRLAKRGEAR